MDDWSLVGSPFLVIERIAIDTGVIAGLALSVSSAGPIAYRTLVDRPTQFVWFDRKGNRVSTVGGPDTGLSLRVELTLDGHMAAFTRRVGGGNADIWLMDMLRGVPERFTSDPANESAAVWSPDGTTIAFSSSRKGLNDLYKKSVGGLEEVLLQSAENKNIMDWSPDGRFILYSVQPQAPRDLWALPLDGDKKPIPVVQTEYEESAGQFSPDSRWIAYTSNEPGRQEVYVHPFPEAGRSYRISTTGGGIPRWSPDAREVFYQTPDGTLMAVPITLRSDRTVQLGTPTVLFSAPPGTGFDTVDGQQFLINMPLDEPGPAPITILSNWNGEKK